MSLDLFEPVLDIVKSAFLGAVVDEDDAHGSLIVGLCDGSESLLSSCVPDLELDSLVLHINRLDLEVDTYSDKQ